MTISGSGRTSGALSFDGMDPPAAEQPTQAAKPAAPVASRSRVSRKSASAFRTISEVSGDLDVPQHVLRFWETKFTQLRPMKRGGGRRYYRPEDVHLLREIKTLLHRDCYTIKGVQKLLKERRAGEPIVELDGEPGAAKPAAAAPAAGPEGALDPALRETLGTLLTELRKLREALSGNNA